MSDITNSSLLVHARENHGSGETKKLRSRGRIPAVFYGKDVLKHYSVEDSQFRTLMRSSGGSLSLLELVDENGSKELALLKELQVNPVNDAILHLDFVNVTRGQLLDTKVPLELIGESPGVKNMGGILEIHQSEILIRCRPSQLPKSLSVNIDGLELGQSLQIQNISLPEGVEIIGDADGNIVTCVGSAGGRADAGETDEPNADEVEGEVPDASDAESESSTS